MSLDMAGYLHGKAMVRNALGPGSDMFQEEDEDGGTVFPLSLCHDLRVTMLMMHAARRVLHVTMSERCTI